jgi:hypothetical protein
MVGALTWLFSFLLSKVAASAAGHASEVSNLAAALLLGYASASMMPHRAQIMRGRRSHVSFSR